MPWEGDTDTTPGGRERTMFALLVTHEVRRTFGRHPRGLG